jgi:GNAT superfamily N-acetyltransferase
MISSRLFLPGPIWILEDMHQKMFSDPMTKYQNWYLCYLCVHPDFQGQGIGRDLLIDLQEHVRQYNILERQKAEGKHVSVGEDGTVLGDRQYSIIWHVS